MSKKLLVPYSIENRRPTNRGFIVPMGNSSGPTFISSSSLTQVGFGLVVYTGKEVRPEMLLNKLVDSGVKMYPSVEWGGTRSWQMQTIEKFLELIPNYKIGDIVKCEFENAENILLTKVNRVGVRL